MGWVLLVLGIALWFGAHLFKRVAPAARARLGDPTDPKDKSKGIFAIAILASVVLIVIGYRMTPFISVYYPPVWGVHATNLLVLLGFYFFAVSGAKTRLARVVRHPQLSGFSLWALGHLMANGDLAAVLLFGGFLIWAVLEVILINAQTTWQKPEPAPARKEISAIVITVVLFGIVSAIHTWLGYYPFPG